MFLLKQNNIAATLLCKRLAMSFVFLAMLFFTATCSDQGCIEADDFGEYETQTLEVVANNSSENCVYDQSKSLTDADQGSGLRTCFISGNVTIYDENGDSQTSGTGCMGLPGEKFKNLCANQCVANCAANIGSPSAGSSEPGWLPTGQKTGDANSGVTVKPNSLIYIRAIGNVRLGDKLPYPDFFVRADDPKLQSKTVNWNEQTLDVKTGKTFNLYFSGVINDDSVINGGSTKIGQVGAGNASTIDAKVYNASRRLAAYQIPAPQGYIYDPTQSTQKAKYVNVPLLPDPNVWTCSYSGSDFKQSICNNGSYRENGYVNVDDVLAASNFPVSSDMLTSTLGTYGGVIRWKDDGSRPLAYDPFAAGSILCDNPANCSSVSIVSPSQGRLVGDLSVGDAIIDAPISGVVSFKELLRPTVTSCNADIQVIIKDSRGNDLYFFDGSHDSLAIRVTSSSWTLQHVPVEAGHKIVIRARAAPTYSYGATNVSCDRALAMKFSPYKDIQIDRSGFVSFAVIGGSADGSCDVEARIINPTARRTVSDSSITPDFYEYGDFSSTGLDPFDNYSVPVLYGSKTWLSESSGVVTDNASRKVFVRKGQVIRFSPESWNQNWSSLNGGARECGIGMAMRIEPRPALLCRGYGLTDVANPTCTRKYNTSNGALVGCSEIAMECSDSSNSTYYCPNQDSKTGCLKSLTCKDGVDAGVPDHTPPIPKNTRYDCVLGDDPKCTISSTSGGATYTQAMCNSCSNLRKLRAEQSPFQNISGIAQCYDLESYTGKVANIKNDGTPISADALARGAKILAPFNPQFGYGNFSDFSSTSKVDRDFNNNIIFQINQPITIAQNGRLTFMFLDGLDFYKDFDSKYGDNTPDASPRYSGSNGFKISLSSALEFANGEWLEAKLCKELADDSVSCKRVTINNNALFADQSKIVELNDPTSGNLVPTSKTPFYFDSAGNLMRIQAPTTNDCVNTFVNDTYYCHTNTTFDQSKIRITFKIKDPETPNCLINDPTNPAPTNPDGILMQNTRFRPSDCVVGNPTADASIPKNGITIINGASTICQLNDKAGTTCVAADDDGFNADGSKKVCTKEYRCVSKYANNSGKYYVAVKVKTPGSNISNVVNQVITPVVEVMDGNKDHTKIGQAERIYRLIISDSRYQAILSICLVVMFTFYGLGYLIGVTEAGISDIISKLVKIGLIYLFVGPEGWEWFNKIVVKFFKDGTDYLAFLMASSFDTSPELTNAIQNADFFDKSVLFHSVDKVFGIFFSSTVQKKISALLFASIFGWAYLILIYYGMLLYVYAVGNAVLLYLTSQVFISILFVLGPLFFVFTLFSQTKEMFDKWLSQLISFSLQQVFLLTTLAFFNMMMYEVIKMVLGYKICWDEVWTINIITRITLMSFWTIASLPPRVNAQSDAGNIGNPDGIPSFFTILFLWVIADLMLKFVDFMTNMAASISGGMKASSLASGVKASMKAVQGFVGAPAKELWDKTVGKKLQKLDAHYFDSGKLAEEERKRKTQENAEMSSHKRAFVAAGDEAVKKFKRENGDKLDALKTEEERVKLLTKIRDEAMTAEGKKRGLSDDQIKKVENHKGLNYVGDNVIAGGWQAMKQALSDSGSLNSSIKDRKVDTKYSAKDARERLKNTDEVGREKFLKAVADGDAFVKKSGWEGFKEKAKNTSKVAAGIATGGIAPAAMAISKYVKNFSKYNEARDQLVSEGAIPKMALGIAGYSALPKEMKDKIKERRKLNLAQKKTDGKKRSTANTEAKLRLASHKLRLASQMLDEQESGGESDLSRDQFSPAAIAVGRDRDFAAMMRRGAVSSQIKKERAALAKDELLSRRDQAKSNRIAAEEEYEKYNSDVEEAKSDPEYQEKERNMNQYRKQIADPALSREERNNARKALSDLKKDKDFTEKAAKIKKDIVSRNQAFNKISNYKKAEVALEEQIMDLEARSGKKTSKGPNDDSDDDDNGSKIDGEA